MLTKRRVSIAIIVCACCAASLLHAVTTVTRTGVAASTDGRGGVLLLWSPPQGGWPANGFRVIRTTGSARAIVAERVDVATDREAVAALGPADREAIERFATATPRDPNALDFLILRALTDPTFARALGIGFRDAAPPRVPATYTVEAMTKSGKETIGTTTPISPTDTPQRPPAPVDLRASATRQGVAVTWTKDAASAGASVPVAFILRRKEQGRWVPTTPSPVLPGSAEAKEDETITMVSVLPTAVETRVAYTVVSVDLFGHESAPSAEVEVFVPDFAALDPPSNVTVTQAAGASRVTWEKAANPNAGGFAVERSQNAEGPYSRLTPSPLTAREFSDTTGQGGATYYYRVVSRNRRGEDGPPSLAAVAQFRAARPPAAPSDLTAERKTGKIVLRWRSDNTAALQGYRVERDSGDGNWSILTNIPSTEPRFDDKLPAGVLGVMKYRVVTVGLDGQTSPDSAVVTVTLPRTGIPHPPEITSIDGRDGRVTVEWRPTGEKSEAAAFVVLRSMSRLDEGLIASPQPIASPPSRFIDEDVEAGVDYYYRVVTFDAVGNRSRPSEAAAVRVAAPPIPALPAPTLRVDARPYPRVVATFTAPLGFRGLAVLERREEDGTWRAISAPTPVTATTQIIDLRPRKGRHAYRLAAVASNGARGPISEASDVAVP